MWKASNVMAPNDFFEDCMQYFPVCMEQIWGGPYNSDFRIYADMNNSVIAKIISGVPDKMSGRPSALCRTFWATVRHFPQLMTGKYNWSFLFSLSDILCVLNSAGQNVRQGLSSLPDISISLPDMSGMSGIFRDHWQLIVLKRGIWATLKKLFKTTWKYTM